MRLTETPDNPDNPETPDNPDELIARRIPKLFASQFLTSFRLDKLNKKKKEFAIQILSSRLYATIIPIRLCGSIHVQAFFFQHLSQDVVHAWICYAGFFNQAWLRDWHVFRNLEDFRSDSCERAACRTSRIFIFHAFLREI